MRYLALAITCAAFWCINTAHAKDEEPPALTQPMKLGDQAKSCSQIIDEVSSMETRLGGSPADSMSGEGLANIGTGLAQHAALRAGAGGVAAGAIGQVGGLLGSSSKKKKRREAEQRAIAEKRWLYMVGLYQGKDCDSQPATPAEPQPAAAE